MSRFETTPVYIGGSDNLVYVTESDDPDPDTSSFRVVATYSLSQHGPEFMNLAKQYAAKRNGQTK